MNGAACSHRHTTARRPTAATPGLHRGRIGPGPSRWWGSGRVSAGMPVRARPRRCDGSVLWGGLRPGARPRCVRGLLVAGSAASRCGCRAESCHVTYAIYEINARGCVAASPSRRPGVRRRLRTPGFVRRGPGRARVSRSPVPAGAGRRGWHAKKSRRTLGQDVIYQIRYGASPNLPASAPSRPRSRAAGRWSGGSGGGPGQPGVGW